MRVVIAEDHVLLRDGLTRLLRDNDIDVVAATGDADSLLREVVARRPDLAVVDIRLPPTFHDEGLRAALEVRRQVPGTAVLVVSQYVEPTYAAELLADRGGDAAHCLEEVRDVHDPVFEQVADAAARTARSSGSPHGSARCCR